MGDSLPWKQGAESSILSSPTIKQCRHCECVEEGLECCICNNTGLTDIPFWQIGP